MWDFDLERLGVPGLNAAAGTITLPLWLAALALALLLLFFVLTLLRRGLTGGVVFLTLIAIAGAAAWLFFERERHEERRLVETRLAELRVTGLAAGSPLACLETGAGESVEVACEKVVFASPDAVAAAAAYTAARISLLAEGMRFAGRHDPEYERSLEGLRRGLEQDRFGILANVLMVNNGCTPERCDVFVLLRDATRVRTNMREKTFDTLVARYKANWEQRATPPTSTSLMTSPPSELSPPPPAPAAGAIAEPTLPSLAVPSGPAATPNAGATTTPPRRPTPTATRPPPPPPRTLPPPPPPLNPPRPQ